MAIRRIEGMLHLASEGRYAILVGRFNSFVVEHLLEGAIDTLKRHGVSEDNITVVHAPGAWELPVVAKKLVASELLNKRFSSIHCESCSSRTKEGTPLASSI
jgi:6,7-dimethyl-8-ribityllumazine synthase